MVYFLDREKVFIERIERLDFRICAVWMFDSFEGRNIKESFSILFKGGKMDETRWGE